MKYVAHMPHMLLAGAFALVASPTVAGAQMADQHTVKQAKEIEWRSGPPSIPNGAEFAVLYGDPGKDGLFALRLKLPANYTIPPHTHPKPEIVTVISGTVKLGMDKADKLNAKTLQAGSFFAMKPGMVHYLSTEGEAVVQLNSNGPWSIDYVDPKDDPRS